MMEPVIQATNLEFAYPRSRQLTLVNLNFHLTLGQNYIIGRNGSGKSTLLQVLAGGLKPTAGSLLIDGQASTRTEMFRSVGYVPQVVRPAGNLTVREQVELNGWLKGLSTQSAAAKSVEVLECVGLIDKVSMPARQLSGGQLARLGIAQALIFDPKVLLLDETFASIDPIEQLTCATLLETLAQKIVIVETTHDLSKLRSSAHIVVLNAGHVIWNSTYSDFLSHAESPELALNKLVMDHER